MFEWLENGITELLLSAGLAMAGWYLKKQDARLSTLEGTNTNLEIEKLRTLIVASESMAKDRYVDKIEYMNTMGRLHDKIDEILKILASRKD